MSEKTEIEYALTVNVEDAATQLRQLERLLFRTLSVFRRLGLPEEVDDAVAKIQKLIMLIRQLQITINLFYAASGPIGWGLALVSLLGMTVTASDVSQDWTSFAKGAVSDLQRRGMMPHQ